MNDKTKIYLGKTHLAYVNTELLTVFKKENAIVNYSAWIRKMADESFDILLNDEASVHELQTAVQILYYDDIGDWLQDLMRKRIQKDRPF